MALKTHFSDNEKFGLTDEEIKIAEKYLRKHKTAGAVPQAESHKLYELVLMGYSFHEIQLQYPQYTLAQIILTAALRGWMADRERMQGSLRDRIQAKIVKAVAEEADFLTTMLSVANTEHLDAMRQYIHDPTKPKPQIRIQNIKEYKEVAETLQKLIAGTMSPPKKAPSFDALNSKPSPSKQIAEAKKKEKEEQQIDIASIIAGELDDESN